MKSIALIPLIFITMFNSISIFDFTTGCNISNWSIVDDVVMGGRSNGSFKLSPEGHGVFSGKVSLENNGGFSSVRHRFKTLDVSNYTKIVITLKGDGKPYQFRIKANQEDYYSYITYIKTNNEWQTITVKLKDLYPTFRGRKLDIPNFDKKTIEELAFLIGNKKAETFMLTIDKIELH
ncbi:CIA30 family protein [uncultured Lacinutrix sp.]|uniref:CIA30 family protein n=1 Tax=uncultured Lacinutrix sp. TaxID=574032 RepID=UPI0026222441|nr:CIA30 family protein [uncultured Lacinutrix sp.]